jgi:hypothetical protein
MKLISLPDAKVYKPALTIGKVYEIVGQFGNGYIINTDDGKDRVIVLKARFE